jgi:hypothetical protein
MSEYVGANEPETLVFEWFGSESTRKVVSYQTYASDEAFLTHAQNMIDSGFRAEVQQLFTLDRLLLLTPLTHTRTKEMARQVGAEQLAPIVGVLR